MVRRKYVLFKVIPTVLTLALGFLCLRNIFLEPSQSDSNYQEFNFLPHQEDLKLRNKLNFDTQTRQKNKFRGHRVAKQGSNTFVNKSSRTSCENRKCNFVFIKPMKCATETVVRILRKYSYDNDLNIMLPRKKRIYLAWPYLMDDSDYRLSDRPFNGLIDHAVYNKTIMNRYFPPQTTHYVTIIREPLKHFKSTFNYFRLEQIAGIYGKQPLSEYLDNIKQYESVYKSPEASSYRFCIPNGFSVTKNSIAHCLGMPLGFPHGRPDISNDTAAVRNYIVNIDKEFSLVMVVEYFHESLILFKRLMNWQIKDIIYKTVNKGDYSYPLDSLRKAKHKQWSPIDYMIYEHFNRTLWKKIESEGPNFYDEVEVFTKIQLQVNRYCWGSDKKLKIVLNIMQSKFNSPFNVSRSDCELMDDNWVEQLKAKFDKDNRHVKDHRPDLTRITC